MRLPIDTGTMRSGAGRSTGGTRTSGRKLDDETLLDVRAAADRLGCSERFIRRLVQERRIPFVKLAGTKIRFEETSLDRWIASHRVEVIN